MPLNVSYMGTKRRIAHRVARIIDAAPQGPLLDLFSGMCAVSTAIGQSRHVCCNDIQAFASTVATAFFVSPALTLDCHSAASLALPTFRCNSDDLRSRFYAELKEELGALTSGAVPQIRALEQRMPNIATDKALAQERVTLASCHHDPPYRLFTITYSGAYFGLVQCIEIDSIRFAIDRLLADGHASTSDHRWLCLALCKAVSKVATTTGHFAQHMRVNERNSARFIAQRRRSVWCEWLRAVFDIHPIGTTAWRAGNHVFRQDAASLLGNLQSESNPPAVVYADPPYTRDQYSRYYHIYETLLNYDYPPSHGSGPIPSGPIPLSLFHENTSSASDGSAHLRMCKPRSDARSQLSGARITAFLRRRYHLARTSALLSPSARTLSGRLPLLPWRIQRASDLQSSGKNLRGELNHGK